MEGNSLKTLENLCKIFEMRIKLDKEKDIETPPDVLINYEKNAKKIDSLYNEKFEREVRPLITPEVTIEKEEKRLHKLIELLNNRLEKREELTNRYHEATNKPLKGLQLIVSESELKEKKERLATITKYLDSTNEIAGIKESIIKLKLSLKDEVFKQDKYEKKNKVLEDELYTSLKQILREDEYFKNIKEEDIVSLIKDAEEKAYEYKETLDVTKDSVSSLTFNTNDSEYATYIEEAEKDYYKWINREIILKIYELTMTFEDDFDNIFEKRVKINKLLRKKSSVIEGLNIEVSDSLIPFLKVLDNQVMVLKAEKEVIDNVTNYTNRINFKEERLNELEEENNNVEILAILREYGLIETYNNLDETDLQKEEFIPMEDVSNIDEIPYLENEEIEPVDTIFEDEKDSIIKEVIDPYRIVEVKECPLSLNVNLAKLKGASVREKVSKKLNKTPKTKPIEEVKDEKKEDILPKWQVPTSLEESTPLKVVAPESKPEDNTANKKDSIPKWDFVNLDDNPSKDNEEIKEEENIPVWNINELDSTKEKKFDIPIPNTNEEIPILTKEKKNEETKEASVPIELPTFEEEPSNMFWTPVSDSKLSTGDFPSLNFKLDGNFASDSDNFGFPDID